MSVTANVDSYVSNTEANDYMAGSLQNPTWTAATSTQQDQALITATRMLDRQTWQGEPVDVPPTQPLAWPRTGVTDKYGDAVSSLSVPDDIKNGQIELAVALLLDSSLQNSSSSSTNTKRLKAGSAEIEYFRPTSGGRFPSQVTEYVGPYLQLGVSSLSPVAYGTDVDSFFDVENSYDRSEGFY